MAPGESHLHPRNFLAFAASVGARVQFSDHSNPAASPILLKVARKRSVPNRREPLRPQDSQHREQHDPGSLEDAAPLLRGDCASGDDLLEQGECAIDHESLGHAETTEQRAAAELVIAKLAARYRAQPEAWILDGLDQTPFPAGQPHVLCGFFRAVPADSLTAHYGATPPPSSAFKRCSQP